MLASIISGRTRQDYLWFLLAILFLISLFLNLFGKHVLLFEPPPTPTTFIWSRSGQRENVKINQIFVNGFILFTG